MLAIAAAQMALCMYATTIESWKYYLFLAWSVGGIFTHWLSLGSHELSHNLCFHTTLYNELLGMVGNCAQAIPSCITFKRYHMEHHYKQGEHLTDVDVPTEWEGQFFNNTARKILFIFLQPFFYALRPVVVNPKPTIPKEVLNFVVVMGFNFWLGYNYGARAPFFNFFSTLLGMGLHPVAGHFISEHYTFVAGQETYSYYGPLNLVAFNVGYHNEHHDFPKVSGFRLPEVRRIAPEFYNNLHYYDSWPKVLYDYITRPDMSPYSRVVRYSKKQLQEKGLKASPSLSHLVEERDMALSPSCSKDSPTATEETKKAQ